jgi:hypothetical protein
MPGVTYSPEGREAEAAASPSSTPARASPARDAAAAALTNFFSGLRLGVRRRRSEDASSPPVSPGGPGAVLSWAWWDGGKW